MQGEEKFKKKRQRNELRRKQTSKNTKNAFYLTSTWKRTVIER